MSASERIGVCVCVAAQLCFLLNDIKDKAFAVKLLFHAVNIMRAGEGEETCKNIQ